MGDLAHPPDRTSCDIDHPSLAGHAGLILLVVQAIRS